MLNFDEEMEKETVKRVLNNAHVVDCFKAHSAHSFSEGLSIDTYSGLENRCNVWKFWIDCNVALDSIKITLSAGGME